MICHGTKIDPFGKYEKRSFGLSQMPYGLSRSSIFPVKRSVGPSSRTSFRILCFATCSYHCRGPRIAHFAQVLCPSTLVYPYKSSNPQLVRDDGVHGRQKYDEHTDFEDDELDLGNPVAEARERVVGMAAVLHTVSFRPKGLCAFRFKPLASLLPGRGATLQN